MKSQLFQRCRVYSFVGSLMSHLPRHSSLCVGRPGAGECTKSPARITLHYETLCVVGHNRVKEELQGPQETAVAPSSRVCPDPRLGSARSGPPAERARRTLMSVEKWAQLHRWVSRVGHDDACHLHDTISKAARQGIPAAQEMLISVDFFIDAWHLRGPKRKSCQEKFNPNTRPFAPKKNTEAAEQTWAYLNKHRHSLRYCGRAAFEIHVLWIVCWRNLSQW